MELGLFDLAKLISVAKDRVELQIMRTPTGPKRDLLTHANIHLMAAEESLRQAEATRQGARS